MCASQAGDGKKNAFDPTRCPLLQGLSCEDADRMMATDSRIRACIDAIENGRNSLEPCVAKMVRAHDRRAPDATARVA
ncbi:MAG: hypothetical protein ABTQ29_07875 [Siculibacillus sp.]